MSERSYIIPDDGRSSGQMSDWLPRYVYRQTHAVLLLGLMTAVMIAVLAMPRAIYIRSYLQDTLGLLDGIHRTVLGQVAHRDFSTPIGLFVYALPALLVRAGADLVMSLSYSACVLLIINFMVLWHLVTTRIQGPVSLLFGSWTVLALTRV